MSMKFTLKAALACTFLAVTATAGGHTAVEQRITAMKAVGGQMRTLGGMAQGQVAYDATAAIAALQIMRNSAAAALPLFADPTAAGAETRARAEIWADGSDFNDRLSAMIADMDVAIAAAPADAAAFGPLFGAVAGNCRSCHEKYRAPEN
ncbi:MAG: cytochrome c [Rhodobacteraceae bacterium]|nr:cytochrome c [Paracoccaceae bacterium]